MHIMHINWTNYLAAHLRMMTQETHSTTVSRANRKQAMTSPFLTLFGAAVSQSELF